MKSNKNIYFLVPAVLLVWGIIAYRIYSSVNPKESNVVLESKPEKFQPENSNKKEKYILKANYRDPFLGTIEKPKMKKRIVQKPKEKVVFPNIMYKGIFSSNLKENTVFLIIVNEKQEMFKLKEIRQNMKLVSGDKEKITMEYKSGRQTYYLNK